MKRKWLLLMVVLLMSWLVGTGCQKQEESKSNPIQILLDGKQIQFDVEPVMVNEKVYAEYSSLLKALGYQPQYDSNTKTIKAISPNRTIEISEDGMNSFVDGKPVFTFEDLKKMDGHMMIAVDFVAINSGKKVNWDDKKNRVLITGPTPEQEAAVFSILNKYSKLEASQDTEAYRKLFTSDTKTNVNELLHQWDNVNTKTTFQSMFIDWYSEQEVVLLAKAHVEKISGSFFPENYSEFRYVLHKENGEWKIYLLEFFDHQYVNPEKLFDQAIEVPTKVKAEIEALLHAQFEALNNKDTESYASLNYYTSKQVKDTYLSLLTIVFNGVSNSIIEKWDVVDYTEPDHVTVLVSKVQDFTNQGKVRKIYSIGLVKRDGQWKFLLNTAVYRTESVK